MLIQIFCLFIDDTLVFDEVAMTDDSTGADSSPDAFSAGQNLFLLLAK